MRFNNLIVYCPSDFAIFSTFYWTAQQTVQYCKLHVHVGFARKQTTTSPQKQIAQKKLTKALSFKIKFSSWTSPVNVNIYYFKNTRFKMRSTQKLVQLPLRSTHLPKSQFLAAMNLDSPSTGRRTYLEDRLRRTRTP